MFLKILAIVVSTSIGLFLGALLASFRNSNIGLKFKSHRVWDEIKKEWKEV